MTALEAVAGWLSCPHCGAALELAGRTLRCAAGHTFDVARQGYVNLLGRGQPRNADTAEMLEARDRFLAAGHFAPIADAIAAGLDGSAKVLEVGSGTGYYLAHALPTEALGVAADVSVPAARRAARAHPDVAAIVADTWAGLPLADASVDAVLCAFAPRNAAEFSRVLRAGGRLVVAVPNPGHLAELRQEYGLLDVGEAKLASLEAWFGEPERAERVRFELHLDERAATDLVAMGPNAFHGAPRAAALTTTADVTVALWRGLGASSLL